MICRLAYYTGLLPTACCSHVAAVAASTECTWVSTSSGVYYTVEDIIINVENTDFN